MAAALQLQFPADQLYNLYRVAPEIILGFFGILVMLAEPFLPAAKKHVSAWLALLGGIAALASLELVSWYRGPAYGGLMRADDFSIFVHAIVIVVFILVTLGSVQYLDNERLQRGEFYALLLFATAGMGILAGSGELITAFLGLEMSSISSYILCGFRRNAEKSAEASLKYFLLGSFATAFFLYGVAMIYGATGTTNIYNIANFLHTQQSTLAYLAVGLMFVGLGFKVASAPFHVWTPDVYEGSPAPVVALMSTGPKAAAFAVLLRVLFGTGAPGWFWMVWVSAALSMTLGNIGALVQQNVKRLLAYSSIAHAGYILVAFAAGQR